MLLHPTTLTMLAADRKVEVQDALRRCSHLGSPASRRVPRPRALAALGLTVLAVLGAACGQDGGSAVASGEPPAEATPALAVVADDHTFTLGSDRVEEGLVDVTLRNDGDEPHQVSLARLDEGVSVDEVVERLHTDETAAYDLMEFAGGVNPVEHGRTGAVRTELKAGRYALICFVPSQDGRSHYDKGMVKEVEVVADGSLALDEDDDERPKDVVGEVVLSDFAVTLGPDGLDRPGTYRFVNEGTEPHEAVFLRIKDGRTLADVVAFQEAGAKGEPPFTFEGGPAAVAAGGEVYADLDLEPGSWVAVCAIRGEHTGVPHLEMGMVLPFEVH